MSALNLSRARSVSSSGLLNLLRAFTMPQRRRCSPMRFARKLIHGAINLSSTAFTFTLH